jgi:hypothetical protein
MTNLELWKKVQNVPDNAKKAITGGRLKGMTDINPMWRLQALTEQFGPCGIGWKYEVVNKWLEHGADGEIAAFVDINLYFADPQCGEWSAAIPGTGGAAFVANEKNGPHTSDECFKMALTDAISVACKALGFGADVYWQAGGSKYGTRPDGDPKGSLQKSGKCSVCGVDIPPAVATYSTQKLGKALCLKCQKEAK